MNPIERVMTEAEKKDFRQLGIPTAKDYFVKKLYEESIKAQKKGLPFAEQAARDAWIEHYETEKKRVLRAFGYIKESEIKQASIDFDKFCDLNNFELVENGETYDSNFSKRFLREVYLKFRKYKFKGYVNTYTVMEPYPGVWNDKVIKEVSQMRDSKQIKTSKLSN